MHPTLVILVVGSALVGHHTPHLQRVASQGWPAGVTPVPDAVHANRALRQAGLIRVRTGMGREILDAGASPALALANHQLARIYVQHGIDPAAVKAMIEGLDGQDGAGPGGQARWWPGPPVRPVLS